MITRKQKEQFIEELRKTPVVQIACQKTGLSRTSYYRLRKQSKSFAKAADKALAEGRLVVNDLGEAQTIALMKNSNMQAIKFWMTHNDPRYSNKLEINGHVVHVSAELTKEQTKLLRQAINLSLPHNSYDSDNTPSDNESGDQTS